MRCRFSDDVMKVAAMKKNSGDVVWIDWSIDDDAEKCCGSGTIGEDCCDAKIFYDSAERELKGECWNFL